MHLLALVTEQENLISFLRDHISPWPLHHMVARQPESPSQLASLQARRSGCKSAHSASILGRWMGTQAGTKFMEEARTLQPWPPEILQRLQCLSGYTAYLSTGLLTLRLCPQFPTFLSSCCAAVIPYLDPLFLPAFHSGSISRLSPLPAWWCRLRKKTAPRALSKEDSVAFFYWASCVPGNARQCIVLLTTSLEADTIIITPFYR